MAIRLWLSLADAALRVDAAAAQGTPPDSRDEIGAAVAEVHLTLTDESVVWSCSCSAFDRMVGHQTQIHNIGAGDAPVYVGEGEDGHLSVYKHKFTDGSEFLLFASVSVMKLLVNQPSGAATYEAWRDLTPARSWGEGSGFRLQDRAAGNCAKGSAHP